MRQKRFQYWGILNGKPQKLWTRWFNFKGLEYPVQLKGYKGDNLLNEFRTI